MIESLDQLTVSEVLEAGVGIIGRGPAGLIATLEVTASGIQSVMVEGGDLRPTKEKDLYGRDVGDCGFRGPRPGRSLQFGGATKSWGGQCVTHEAHDFEKLSWVPFSGWPISPGTLTPFHEPAPRHLNVTAEPAFDGTSSKTCPAPRGRDRMSAAKLTPRCDVDRDQAGWR